MVILNLFGKIQPICISKKLKIFISNLPNDIDDDMKQKFVFEMKANILHNMIEKNKFSEKPRYDIFFSLKKKFPGQKSSFEIDKENYFQEIADNAIYMYFDFSYNDMPLGEMDENPFDKRFCEDDYAEKILNFINYMEDSISPELGGNRVDYIYSSNHEGENNGVIFFREQNLDVGIKVLKKWGELFDGFLNAKDDYLKLDYLFNALYKDNEYNEYHYFKAYSLCQMMLENRGETELDWKLPEFIDDNSLSSEKKENIALILRQIRNKIGHGDFVALDTKLKALAEETMNNRFWFDYSELSKRNWILSFACGEIDSCVRRIIFTMLTDRNRIETIKKQTKK